MTTVEVRSVEELVRLCEDGVEDFVIALNGPFLSRKTIRVIGPGGRWKSPQFDVFNHIDDTWQTLWPKQLWTRSNIGAAMDAGSFYAERS